MGYGCRSYRATTQGVRGMTQAIEESKRSKDKDLIKKKQQELFDKNYATRPGIALKVSADVWDRIFGKKEE